VINQLPLFRLISTRREAPSCFFPRSRLFFFPGTKPGLLHEGSSPDILLFPFCNRFLQREVGFFETAKASRQVRVLALGIGCNTLLPPPCPSPCLFSTSSLLIATRFPFWHAEWRSASPPRKGWDLEALFWEPPRTLSVRPLLSLLVFFFD